MSEDILARIIIAVLGVCGFFVARHIYKEKKADRPLICPVNFDCQGVVHSDYAKFLGIKVEILGMCYYALVTLGYIFLSFMPEVLPQILLDTLILISIGAFLFSVYLTIVQSFVLKKFCSWCLVSATICALIFVCTLVAYDFNTIFFIPIR